LSIQLIVWAYLAHTGQRARAKLVLMAIASVLAVGWGVLTPLFQPFGETAWGVCLRGWCASTICLGLVYYPHQVFLRFSMCLPMLCKIHGDITLT